ncbi:MAG: hypothetical protein COA78_25235 [Blastopirellula sp.]|nr:MAG: hypothetical protein COA78_25235 [Blastopirellula sp.]
MNNKEKKVWLLFDHNDALQELLTYDSIEESKDYPNEWIPWKNGEPHPSFVLSIDKPRFKEVWCSQCGKDFGSGDSGYSHCADHP